MNATSELAIPQHRRTVLPRLVYANGTLEFLKWLALVLMVLDHINKFLFNETLPYIFEAARICMPVFGFVLAYNLARPGALEKGVHVRVMRRLALYGALATPFFMLMVGPLPLNILFMLLVATATIYMAERGGFWWICAALLLFVIGGALVEFWWPAVAFIVAAWRYCKSPSWTALSLIILALIVTYLVNGNYWALLALPLLYVAQFVTIKVNRRRAVFYAVYPLHLALLFLIPWVL